MEAAEGETVEPTVVIGGVDVGGIEAQVVRVRRISRISRTTPGVRTDARVVQSTGVRMGEASTGEPQRRKRNMQQKRSSAVGTFGAVQNFDTFILSDQSGNVNDLTVFRVLLNNPTKKVVL